MRVVIIEDEKSAAENLNHLLGDLNLSVKVDKIIDTVSDAIDYFKKEPKVELAFLDIHLADGNSFDIFKDVVVNVPVIFTTAYDEYALKAFKVNSIDYLLKPIDEDELREAIEKYKSSRPLRQDSLEFISIIELLKKETKKYKSTFLLRRRDQFIPVEVANIAYITIEAGIVKAISSKGKSYVMDEKLEDIEAELDPDQFFRANRQFIVNKTAISNLTVFFNGKLILNVLPKSKERIIVSKAKAPLLKAWID